MMNDQAARRAREPGIPALVKVKDDWTNRRHVIGLSRLPPRTAESNEGRTIIRMTDGSLIDVDAPLDEVAAAINEDLH